MRNKIINRIAVIEWPAIRRPKQAVVLPLEVGLVGEWQQHGPITLSGFALPKLRLTLAPIQVATTRCRKPAMLQMEDVRP